MHSSYKRCGQIRFHLSRFGPLKSVSAAFSFLHVRLHPWLPIQGSSTATERAFSSGSLTGTKLRSKLTL
ncbi:hypothetical protein B0H17DRAFT_928294 [Mycena rosella]|uniref:HAT C-terminal dimerisation domain-containing protein n=1 Tax=Mycena rosella TaxID=1033263 RepID=A0AAD7DRK7_MYCRO|nr:hypothetical protein B0H17DRAFT_928294 [Mycena rosella]